MVKKGRNLKFQNRPLRISIRICERSTPLDCVSFKAAKRMHDKIFTDQGRQLSSSLPEMLVRPLQPLGSSRPPNDGRGGMGRKR